MQEFIRFLNKIAAEPPSDLALHLIVDNYGTPKHSPVKAWLRRHPRVHLHVISTSSSWLNLVERWFRELTDKPLRRGSFHHVPELIAAITQDLDHHHQSPPGVRVDRLGGKYFATVAHCKRSVRRTTLARMAHELSEVHLGYLGV